METYKYFNYNLLSMQLAIVIAITVVMIIAPLVTFPKVYSQNNEFSTMQQLGEYKVVNVANVPHLQDKNGFFVFPAFCPTACSAAWTKTDPIERTGTSETRAPVASSGNNVYVAWWSNRTGDWEVMFRASNDNGNTFGPKINLSNSTGVISNDAEITASGNNVYVTWWERTSNSSEPVMRVSNNNGDTFGNIIILSNASALPPSVSNNMTTTNVTNTSFSSGNTEPTTVQTRGSDIQYVEQYRIGAIKAEFTKPGTYSFSYFIKPLLGEFQDLDSLQVITIPTSTDEGYAPLDQISWYKYPYTTVGKSVFEIKKPGTYIIGFGPAQGAALTELEVDGIPSGFTLKYKVDPLQNVKILKADMDIHIKVKQQDRGIYYETVGYEDMQGNDVLSQAQQISLDGLRNIGLSDENARWLIIRGVSNTLFGGADLRYPLGRNADFAVMRIAEFSPILRQIMTNGDLETAKITTAKILTYVSLLIGEANTKGISLSQDEHHKFNMAKDLWLQGDYQKVLPLAAEIAKGILPIVHPEWQKKPAFSVYHLNAGVRDLASGEPLSLSGLPVTINFGDKSEKVVNTNSRGESVFIGPSGKFSIYGITPGTSVNAGMTDVNLVMNENTGKWLIHTSSYAP
jgi:hypothetical protein